MIQQMRPRSADTKTCSLCHDSVRKPVRLPCQHIYCNTCMRREFEKRHGHQAAHDTLSTLMCPYCKDYFTPDREKATMATKVQQSDAFNKRVETKSERCQPCQASGEYTPALHWCTVCKEYFCSLCSKYHRTMKMSKDHTMKKVKDVKDAQLVQAQTPRSHAVLAENPKCDPCRQQKKIKPAKLLCPRCSEKFCEDCAHCHRSMKMSKTHKLVPIQEERPKPDIYGNSLTCSTHYGEALNLYCKRCLTSCCAVCAITIHSKCVGGGARVDMSASFAKDAKLLERSTTVIGYSTTTDDRMSKERAPHMIRFDSSADDGYSSFSTGNPRSKSPVRKTKPISQLRMDNRKMRINFGGSADGDWVISMAVKPNGDILLIELYQSELKQIDCTGNLLASCRFHADPWAVTIVDEKLAAVTFSDRNQIQLVNMKPRKLEAGKIIPTKHKCLGICMANRFLVTTCWEGCVHIMSTTGSELFTFSKDNRGNRLFTSPEYIASNPAENEIYISDYKRNTVTALYINGYMVESKPKWIFSEKDLQGPKGVVVGADDTVYVSGMTSQNIVRISPEGKKIQAFGRRDENDYYEAIYITPAADKMLVSAYQDNTILVLKLHK